MSRKRRSNRLSKPELPEWPTSVVGAKYVRMLEKHVRKLRDGQHGNRQLFLDDLFIALLLAFFNATIRSLRTIEDFSQTRQAQRFLSVTKLCRSTMSDFNQLVDPQLLEPLIARLLGEVRQRCGPQALPDLPAQLQTVLAVEGSFFRAAPDIDLREIIITSPDEPGRLVRLLTNLWDQPAWVIALIYRYRWQVELFFRWLKVSTNFRHLISESRTGILLSFYVALIGVLLQCAHTGTKLNKYAYNLLGMVAAGQAELDDILPIVAARNRQIELDKASLARRRAKKHV